MGIAGHNFAGSEADSQCFGSDFHQMSHELRNPLNSINGFAELLLMDDGLSSTHADYVRAILTGSEALTAVVVSLLDRVEACDPPANNPGTGTVRKPFAEAQACRSIFARASHWRSQRRRGRSGTR